MNFDLLLENATNPALLFFLLGIIAVLVKSDLAIPRTSSNFISIYLLFSIGFKGGHELAHSSFDLEILYTFSYALIAASVVPIYVFFLLKKKYGIYTAAAISAAYGSVSAVTFVTGLSYLEVQHVESDGYMVAVMALMEVPAIAIGVVLLNRFKKDPKEGAKKVKTSGIILHSFTNASILIIIGSLVIGFLSNDAQADEIKPFTPDIFKGFLAIFLLDMGIASGKKLQSFFQMGFSSVFIAVAIALVNGVITAWCTQYFLSSPGNRFMLTILVASASYIAVPAAMRLAAPKANPGIYIPMALAITFPFNITLGFPIYYSIIAS
jgi:hypothetical protein